MFSAADIEGLTKLLAPVKEENAEENCIGKLSSNDPSKANIPDSEKNFDAVITSNRKANYHLNLFSEPQYNL